MTEQLVVRLDWGQYRYGWSINSGNVRSYVLPCRDSQLSPTWETASPHLDRPPVSWAGFVGELGAAERTKPVFDQGVTTQEQAAGTAAPGSLASDAERHLVTQL